MNVPNSLRDFWRVVRNAVVFLCTILVAIIALIGGYHAFVTYIDKKIEKKVNDPTFIKKLSHNIRPSGRLRCERQHFGRYGGHGIHQ